MTHREFGICQSCRSAVLLTFRNSTGKEVKGLTSRGLCLKCAPDQAADKLYVRPETSGDMPDRENSHEEWLHDSMGLSRQTYYDEYGNPLTEDELRVTDTFYDEYGNVVDGPEFGHRLTGRERGKAASLEAAADKLINEAAIREQADARRSPEQAAFDELRERHFLKRRDLKTKFFPASINQFKALVSLGHNRETLFSLKLSSDDASKLLQKGPRWKWKA